MNVGSLLRYREAGDLEALIEALWVFVNQCDRMSKLTSDLRNMVDNVVSWKGKTEDLIEAERSLLWESTTYLVKTMMGIDSTDITEELHVVRNQEEPLQGNYWIVPSIHGFVKCDEHHKFAMENKDLFCGSLPIDDWGYVHAIHSGEGELLPMILKAGGVRANFSRNDIGRRVGFFQTCQKSLPWLKGKISRMPLLKATIKVYDPAKKYVGWESGIMFVLKK